MVKIKKNLGLRNFNLSPHSHMGTCMGRLGKLALRAKPSPIYYIGSYYFMLIYCFLINNTNLKGENYTGFVKCQHFIKVVAES
jgi:hypothetical protein